jgi:hypothetical protein
MLGGHFAEPRGVIGLGGGVAAMDVSGADEVVVGGGRDDVVGGGHEKVLGSLFAVLGWGRLLV